MAENRKSQKQLFHDRTMKKHRNQYQNNWIPEEIQFRILRNLPGKSLMRFKCINKSWNSMISDPNFINKTPQLILCDGTSIYLLNSEVSSIKARKLSLPEKAKRNIVISLMASCNGILWMKVSDINLLWNPFTGEHTIIPNGQSHLGFRKPAGKEGYGFGYDDTTKDYKIICIPSFRLRKPFIYLVKTGSSESLEEIIPHYSAMVFYREEGFLMEDSNFLCWPIAYRCDRITMDSNNSTCKFCYENRPRRPHLLILEIDLMNRKQVLFRQPLNEINEYNWYDAQIVRKLMDFKGSLCAATEDRIHRITDLWILKEDKCKQNWMKFMSIDFNNIDIYWDFWAKPIYIKSDEEVLLSDINQEEILCYNRNNSPENRFQSVEIDGVENWYQEITYSQSLAPIQSYGPWDRLDL